MFKRFLFALLAVAAIAVMGQVAPGENLVLNGSLEADQIDFPMFWSRQPVETVTYHASGAPEGKAFFTIKSRPGIGEEIKVRQQGMKLVAGEPYKISAWVKTKDFSCGHYGVVVHNSGWFLEKGLTNFPANSDWTFMENTFTMMESRDGEYGVVLFAVKMKGEISVANIKLEAMSEAAQKGSRTSELLHAQLQPRLVPWQPLLNHIPLQNPNLEMRFFGSFLKGTAADHIFMYAVDKQPAVRKTLEKVSNNVDLQGLAAGDHNLTVSILERVSGKEVFADQFVVTLVDKAPVDTTGHRRLNNLVTELLAQPVTNFAEQVISFSNPRDGWVYVVCQSNMVLPQMKVALADGTVLITAATSGREAFRWLPTGKHQLRVSGAASSQLVVRAVPTLFSYPPCQNNHLPENPPFDWEWHKQHVLPAVNTLNGGNIPEQFRPEVKERGLLWLANLGSTKLQSPEDLLTRFSRNPGMRQPWYDGVTCDEQFFSQPTIDLYTRGLRQLDNPNNRLVYTWIVGKPTLPGIHHAFMSASLNTSRGHGKLLYEAYCRSRNTEEEASQYMQGYVIDTMERFNAYYPNAAAGTGIIFGNFNQIPILSLDHNPAVDSKYYLDMQLNLIANHPAFVDLGATGYWGSYYADEEYNRWSFRILRHYGVEGRKDMLSPKHGFKYLPGHLQNPDFQDGLTSWRVQAAAAGSVVPDKSSGYGKNSQGRWGGTVGIGDQVCVLKRQAGQPNRVSQTATGLQVGKVYTLQFVVADWKDVKSKKTAPRRFGIDVELSSGAAIIPEQSYVHVDQRDKGRYEHNTNVARINLHHITFKAQQSEVVLTFHDQAASPDEELALNYVMLKPYYGVEQILAP